MRLYPLFLSAIVCLGSPVALAADFTLFGSYAQSRDFWKTVQDVQDKTGNLPEIHSVVKDRYGHPDILYSYLDASYAFDHAYSLPSAFGQTVIGTRAEALAGGEISNPVSPEIQAYANSVGILSFGLRSSPAYAAESSFWQIRALLGLGPEKRLYAQGAEFIEAIPVRSGTLLLGGADLVFVNTSAVGEDFWITSDFLIRPIYFHSSTPSPKSRKEDLYFTTWRWKLQNEWLKETNTFLSSQTRFGIVSTFGQSPFPYMELPITWDYQQRLEFFPGLGSVSGLGLITRLLTSSGIPNLALYGGYFGGALGAGIDFQLGAVLMNASTYGVENFLIPAREKTRLWQLSLGVSL